MQKQKLKKKGKTYENHKLVRQFECLQLCLLLSPLLRCLKLGGLSPAELVILYVYVLYHTTTNKSERIANTN